MKNKPLLLLFLTLFLVSFTFCEENNYGDGNNDGNFMEPLPQEPCNVSPADIQEDPNIRILGYTNDKSQNLLIALTEYETCADMVFEDVDDFSPVAGAKIVEVPCNGAEPSAFHFLNYEASKPKTIVLKNKVRNYALEDHQICNSEALLQWFQLGTKRVKFTLGYDTFAYQFSSSDPNLPDAPDRTDLENMIIGSECPAAAPILRKYFYQHSEELTNM